jgi:hypothetical protein
MFCPRCGQENPSGANYCTRCGAALSPVGAVEPGVGSAFAGGWRTLRRNFAGLFLAVIIFLALTLPVGVALGLVVYYAGEGPFFSDTGRLFETTPWQFQLPNGIIGIFYYFPLLFGLFFVFLKPARGEKINLGDLFTSFRHYRGVLPATLLWAVVSGGVSFLLDLLTGHFPVLGAFLSLVWFIFYIVLVCKLVFVPLLLLDRHLSFTEALKTSWRMTHGREWQVFAIGLLFVLMFAALGIIALLISLVFILVPVALLLGIVVGVVGTIFLSMWLMATYASLYHAVNRLSGV